jgi:hypothetical protein
MSGMVSEAVSVRQSQNRLPTVRLILRGRYWQNKASPSARTGDPDFERPRLRSSALILRLFSVGCGLRGALFGRLVSLPQLHAGLIQAANTPPGRLAQSSAAACCPTRLTDDIARPHGANRAMILNWNFYWRHANKKIPITAPAPVFAHRMVMYRTILSKRGAPNVGRGSTSGTWTVTVISSFGLVIFDCGGVAPSCRFRGPSFC